MIEEQFPDEAFIRSLMDNGRVLYMLDSYNEIELLYTDDKECCCELEAFLYKAAIAASRTGTREGSYRNYKLEAVEESYVKEYLYRNGLGSLADRPVIMGIFRSPLYFQLLLNGRISVEETSTANDLYRSYFRHLNRNIRERFGITADMVSMLRNLAFELFDRGAEQCSMLVLEHLHQQSDGKLLDYYIQLEEAYVRLPVTRLHEGVLRRLMEKGNLLGGIAGGWLLSVCGNEVKDEMIRLIFRHCRDDFNFVTRIAGVLRGHITEEDYKEIVIRLHDYEDDSEDGLFRFSELAYDFSLEQITGIFENAGELNHVQRRVLAGILSNEGSQAAFEMCLKRYLAGWDEMLFPLYLFVRYDEALMEKMSVALAGRLTHDIGLGKGKWAAGLLYVLYHKSDAAAKHVRSRLKYTSGVVRQAFYYVIGKNRTKSFFSSFISMLYWEELPDGMLDAFEEVDWTDYAGGVIRVLCEQKRLDALARFR